MVHRKDKDMKKYMDFNSGEIWTEEELREAYDDFCSEMPYESYDDYIETMLALGAQKTGGLVEA